MTHPQIYPKTASAIILVLVCALSAGAQSTSEVEAAQDVRRQIIEARDAGQNVTPQDITRMDRRAFAELANPPAQPTTTARPVDAFQGCETTGAAPAEIMDPQTRIAEAVRPVDPITQREFVSFSLEELEANPNDLPDGECWYRLDGIWRQDQTISLDTSFVPDGWGSTKPELISLANGTYTTPEHISIKPSEDSNQYIDVQAAIGLSPIIRYVSADDVNLKDVLKRNGKRKTYRATNPSVGFPDQLTVDVTRTGYVRMTLGRDVFLRPRPGTAKSEWDSQISNRDPFMIGFTMENLIASRRGYDLVTQNPNRLLDNSKAEIFERSDRGYAIDEKRIVPLGFRLIKEETQGMLYYTELVSSESEIQEMTSSNFGNSTKFGVSGSANGGSEKRGDNTGKSKGGAVNIEAGLSWGSSSSKEAFESLKNSNSVAKETGYMRFRKYAIVLDHPYAQLSDGFVDAVEDARRYGDYGRLIEKYGTHYPYAVSYGAAGQVTQTITSRAYEREASDSSDDRSESNASFVVGNTSSYKSETSKSSSSFKETNEFGERYFDAAGGNGSWNENGFSAGDASYPILADMRPLDDLLNPINFPNEPEVYDRVRIELAQAIERYLLNNAELSEVSLLPDLNKPQKWKIGARMIACDSAGSEPNDTLELAGRITIRASANPGSVNFNQFHPFDINEAKVNAGQIGVYELSCAKGRRKASTSRIVTGTAAQLKNLRYRVHANLTEFDYGGAFDPDDEIKGRSGQFSIPNEPVGFHKRESWRLPPGNEGTHIGFHWTIERIE